MIMFWSVVPFYQHNWKAPGYVAWKRLEFKRADKELSTNVPFWWSPCNELPHFACSHEEKLKHQNSSVDFNSKRFLLCLKKKGGFVLGIGSFFRSGRHCDVKHCHEAGPWGVWGWHDACRVVQRRLFCVLLCPLQTSLRWSIWSASQTDLASASLLPCLHFCSSRRFTNAFPALPNSLLKVILNKSLSLPSSLSQRLLDRKIKRLPPPLIVIGSYSFGAFHTVFQGQRASCLDFLCCCWHLVGTVVWHCLHLR